MSSPTPQQFCLRWNNHSSALLSIFEQLLQTEIFTDVTLAIDGVLLKAHKLVLSACSPYFQMIFASHNSKHPIVILKDVHYQDMRALLDFMYRGEVSVDQDRLPQFLHLAETLRIRGLAEVGDYSQQPDSIFKCESSIADADRVQKGPLDSQYPVAYSPYQRYQLNSPYPPDSLQSPNDLLKRPGSPFQSYASRRKRGRPPKIGGGAEYADPMDVLDVKVDSGFSGITNVYPPRHSSTPLTPQSTEGQDEENSRDLVKNRTPPEEMGVKKEWTPPIEIQAGSSKEDSHGTNHSGDINGDESGQLLGVTRIRKPIKPGRIRVAALPMVKSEDITPSIDLPPSNETEQLQEMSIRGLNLFKYAAVSDEGVYKCLPCEKDQISRTFKNKYSFQRHAYLYHEGNQRKVFPCLLCGREFSRPDKLKHHAKTVHDPQASKEINLSNYFHHMPASGILAEGLPRIDSISGSIDIPAPLALVTDRASPQC
ncbi:protein tramtrack, alpha isoform-like isoform X1 [Artemia franciscana]|uniref:Uncharacterized protein n=1 Tax=Artemia franciscana TaxID=6661 RepID=A0AA88LB54_ARTSF|nr:hypothetical protein QYM36_005288 [Artemia franciscana]